MAGPTIVVSSIEDVPLLTVAGELDHSIGPELTKAVEVRLARGQRIVCCSISGCALISTVAVST